jgi:hypothetical protein
MAKQKRKLIEKLLFEVYDKGLQQNDCNLTDYYEKILQALNIPLVSKSAKSAKSKIKTDDPNAPWNWKKDSSEL